MQQHYKIYFDGEIANNFNSDEVKKRAQVVFKLSEENTLTLFNGASHTLKENLSESACRQYLEQLLNIGLIGKSEPPLPADHSTTTQTEPLDAPLSPDKATPITDDVMTDDASKKRTTSKIMPIALIIIVMIGSALFAWQSGYIELPFMDNEAPQLVEIPATPQQAINAPKSPDAIDNRPTQTTTQKDKAIIETCDDPETTHLLEKVLAQGIPQLIARSSPNVHLTIQNYTNNQELYFDSNRNKRLCGVVAKFKVEAPNVPIEIEDPSIIYEIIYELQKEEDQSVRLSTFRQKIISSNLQSTNDGSSSSIE